MLGVSFLSILHLIAVELEIIVIVSSHYNQKPPFKNPRFVSGSDIMNFNFCMSPG